MMIRKVLMMVSLAGALAGCSAASNSIRGKVVSGPVSFIVPVDANDARLKAPGVSDVTVEARAGGGRGAETKYASAKTGESGEFKLSFGDQQQVLLKKIEFVADKPGYQSAKVEMNLPSADRRLLIVLQPSAPGEPSKPSR